MTDQHLRLAREFATVDAQEWAASAQRVLGDRDLSSIDKTVEGIALSALYTSTSVRAGSVGDPPYSRGLRSNQLSRRQVVSNQAELTEVVSGDVTEIIASAGTVQGLNLDRPLGLFLPTGVTSTSAVREHLRWLEQHSICAGGLGLDPLGGHLEYPEVSIDDLGPLVIEAAVAVPEFRSVCVSSRAFHFAGASDVQELGAILSCTAAYLRTLEEQGVSPAAAAGLFEHDLQLDADLFGGISKLRAARKVIGRLLSVCGAEPTSIHLHVTSAERGYAHRESTVNLLRATSASMAAHLGGADSVTLLPHDSLSTPDREGGLGSELGRRMARNTPVVLGEESFLGHVADPGGGSWYIEERSQALAAASWSFFQEIELYGGMRKALDEGWLNDKFSAVASQRARDIAHRRRVVVGANEFAHLDEDPTDYAPTERRSAFAHRSLDEEFERLRAAAASSDGVPCLEIVLIGDRSSHEDRLTWLTNVLTSGGVAATLAVPEGPHQGVVAICGGDDDYGSLGAETVAVLRSNGAREVVIAGSSAQSEAAGASFSVGHGSDLVEFLERVHFELGIQQ